MEQTFSTPKPPRLVVRIPSGTIDIDATGLSDTTVEVTQQGRDPGDDFRIAERGNTIHVVSRKRFSFGKEYEVRIAAPAGTVLEAVRLGSGDVRVRGRVGDVDVKSGSGDVHLDQIEGEARVDCGSGDIRVGAVGGSARFHSASGDVVVGEVARGITVRTASGDITVEAATAGEVKLQSASGDLDVGIRRGSRVFVDARSMSGDTKSELELGEAPSGGNGEAPLVELKAQTMSGDITVRRA
jgi:hypothetical protein